MRRPRLTSYTSGLDPCGVASFQARVAAALEGVAEVETVRLPAGRVYGRHLRATLNRRAECRELARRSRGSDGVLIDYTDTFWNGSRPGENLFPLFVRHLARPPVVVLHELPGRTDDADVEGLYPVKAAQRLAQKAFAAFDTRSLDYRRHVETRLFSGAAHLVTYAVALAAARAYDLPRGRLHLLPTPAYPLPAPAWTRDETDARLGTAGRKVAILFGFPQPSKGFDRAIAALAHLPESVTLVQLGDPGRAADYQRQLCEQAQALGVAGRYRVPGRLSDAELASALQRADVAVAPFRSVHQSSSLGHLVAAGVPVVASQLATTEVMAGDGAGFVFADGDDPRALARAVALVLDNEAYRGRLVGRNRSYAAAHSFDSTARVLLNLATGAGR